MKNNYGRKEYIIRLTVVTLFIISFFSVVSTEKEVFTNITYDINSNRSVKVMHLVSKYILDNVQTKKVTTINEIALYGKNYSVIFNGVTKGYGVNKNSTRTTCSPYHNKIDGNIFYQDYQFGKARIVQTNSEIPCGTIIKISKLKNYSEFYAIVLDHSSINLGTTVNLLFESDEVALSFENATATYTIVRWGW